MANPGRSYAQHSDHSVVVAPFQRARGRPSNGEVLVDTEHALLLKEANYPAVYYLPRNDARMERLVPSDKHTRCPFKGETSCFSAQGRAENAVWSYEPPYDEVSSIREQLAFHPDRVSSITVEPD